MSNNSLRWWAGWPQQNGVGRLKVLMYCKTSTATAVTVKISGDCVCMYVDVKECKYASEVVVVVGVWCVAKRVWW